MAIYAHKNNDSILHSWLFIVYREIFLRALQQPSVIYKLYTIISFPDEESEASIRQSVEVVSRFMPRTSVSKTGALVSTSSTSCQAWLPAKPKAAPQLESKR